MQDYSKITESDKQNQPQRGAKEDYTQINPPCAGGGFMLRPIDSAYDRGCSSTTQLTEDMVFCIQKENDGYKFFIWADEESSINDDGANCIFNFDFGDRTDAEIIEFLRDSVAEEI